ncbi:MAG: hypothetical protein AAGA56_14100, partial [Myxococcota bacterium]
RREADIAVRIAAEAPGNLLGRKHAEVFYAIYGSRDLVSRTGIDAGYGDYPWLSWDLRIGRATDRYLEEEVEGSSIVMRGDKMQVMVDALRASIGITIIPCMVGDRIPDLCRIGSYFRGGNHLWVLTHAELRGTARVQAFTAFVRDLIRRDRDLIEGRRPAGGPPDQPSASASST